MWWARRIAEGFGFATLLALALYGAWCLLR